VTSSDDSLEPIEGSMSPLARKVLRAAPWVLLGIGLLLPVVAIAVVDVAPRDDRDLLPARVELAEEANLREPWERAAAALALDAEGVSRFQRFEREPGSEIVASFARADVELLERNAQALAELAEAARRPAAQWPPPVPPGLAFDWRAASPLHGLWCLHVARLLADGEGEAALDAALAWARIGARIARDPAGLVGLLWGARMREQGLELVVVCLRRADLAPERSRRLVSELDALRGSDDDLAAAWRSEYAWYKASVDWMLSLGAAPAALGPGAASDLWSRVQFKRGRTQNLVADCFRTALAALRAGGTPAVRKAMGPARGPGTLDFLLGNGVGARLPRSFEKLWQLDWDRVRIDAVRAAVLLRLHELETGALPASLEALGVAAPLEYDAAARSLTWGERTLEF